MKKAISLMLAFILCLSLCACGKSEAVKNVEAQIESLGEITVGSGEAITSAQTAFNALSEEEQAKVSNISALSSAKVGYAVILIDSIGEVTLESEAAILAAEEAYNGLTDEEKATVTNVDMLTTAIERIDILHKEEALVGRWCSIDNKQSVLTFMKDGIVDLGEGYKTDYIFTDGGVKLEVDIEYNLNYEEFEGVTVLANEYAGMFVREEDYDTVYHKIFVEVDLATADITEYADFVHLDYRLDAFGERVPDDTYLIVSKVYDQGLIYYPNYASTDINNLIVEYGYGEARHGGFPFGATCSAPKFGRMKGTIRFVRSEYVEEYVFNENGRTIQLTLSVAETPAYAPGGEYYLDYPY